MKIETLSRGIFPRSLLLSLTGVILALGAFAITVINREDIMLKENLSARAELLAASVDRVTAEAIVNQDYEVVINQCLLMVESRPEVRYAVVNNQSDGSGIFFVKNPETQKATWTHNEEISEGLWKPEQRISRSEIVDSKLCGEKVMHFWYPFSYSGIDWGWIHVGVSLDEYVTNKRDLYWITVLLAVPGLLIGAIMSFTFARQLTLPISKLQVFAQRVASGDLSQRVSVNSKDELGDLARSMNQMTSDIEDSIKREAELREKDVLLKEIHHRVKNNMQILSSLLRLQARKIPTQEIKSILKESETRIRSMGLIHERLYQAESLSEIDFEGYAKALVQELQRMYHFPQIKTDFDIDDVSLGIDTALPCGLIVNELVSNSLKYGFSANQPGTISLKLSNLENQKKLLIVEDDGKGAETPEELQREGSLGSRLVNMLVEQLNGELKISTAINQGVRTEITFCESQYKKRI